MKIKALVTFSGAFSMTKGEVMECSDNATLQDLLQAKYIEEVKVEKSKKDVKSNESKRNNNKRIS